MRPSTVDETVGSIMTDSVAMSTTEQEHPDVILINKLVNENISRVESADDPDDAYRKLLAGRIDLEALVKASVVRAGTIHKINPQVVQWLAAMWVEGFVIGLDWSVVKQDDAVQR